MLALHCVQLNDECQIELLMLHGNTWYFLLYIDLQPGRAVKIGNAPV